jgi:glycosyltransferase involved in cell wall biosynthesis
VHSTPLWPPGWTPPGEGRRGAGQDRRRAYPTFEADRLPGRWVSILNRYAGVLVPSRHSLQVCRESGIDVPVSVVPHIAKPPRPTMDPLNPGLPSAGLAGLPDHLFVFYLIGTWTSRKAVPDAVRAFLGAFTADDEVALVLKTSAEDRVALQRSRHGRDTEPGPHSGMAWFTLARLLAGYPSPPPIRLIAGDQPDGLIRQLHARGDCFLSLARGEGWGLAAFEAGTAGKPVVLTGWGGHCDYLPPGYPYCVRYDLVPTTDDEPDDWFEAAPGQRWARADIGHASRLLRQIYERRDEAARWGRQLQQHILANFTASQVLPVMLDVLSQCEQTRCEQTAGTPPRRAGRGQPGPLGQDRRYPGE